MRTPLPRIRAGSTDLPDLMFPVPVGTRDILPDEMSELRAISSTMSAAFIAAGYGEVSTPALEREETMRQGDPRSVESAYRVADEGGKVLIARPDSTIPIARMVATRFRNAKTPLRFFYMQHVYRSVEPKRGESREFLQAGMELLGSPAPAGDAEGIALLCAVLDAVGLSDYRIVIGDSSLYGRLLDAAGVLYGSAEREAIVYELQTRDLVGLKRELAAVESLSSEQHDQLYTAATLRGGVEILDRPEAAALSELHDLLVQAGVADRVIYDLGLLRAPGYYTGIVFEAIDPAIGFPIGGGGRYDDLVGKFGHELAAFGFALNMERLHIALTAEEKARDSK